MATWLDGLKAELAKLKSNSVELMEPLEEADEEYEHEIGEADEELRRLYHLAISWEKMAASKAIEARYARDRESAEISMQLARMFSRKSRAIFEILWITVRDIFDVWDKPCINMRRGWKIVWFEQRMPSGPEIIGRFFGMGDE